MPTTPVSASAQDRDIHEMTCQAGVIGGGIIVFPESSLTLRVRRYFRQAGIATGSCHLLRHTMATQMLDHGADIRFIQEILGHAKQARYHARLRARVDRQAQGGACGHASGGEACAQDCGCRASGR